MKLTLAFALLICIMPSMLFAEDRIDLYTDMARTQCELNDNGQALYSIYVFLGGTNAASLVRFSAPVPACWQGATWVTDMLPGSRLTIGNTQADFTATLFVPGVGECRTPPVLVCTELVLGAGGSFACCEMRAFGTADNPAFTYVDCAFNEPPLVSGQRITVNPNDTCRCNQPVATQPSTWGRVKSLYR